MLQLDIITLQELASANDLTVLGVTTPVVLEDQIDNLSRWQDSGFFGEMKYLNRPALQLADPATLLPTTRSLIIFAIPYQTKIDSHMKAGFGRVARYAWGNDYHTVLRDALERFVAAVVEHCKENISYRVFSDAVPLLERALAARAKLGFIGKNTMLINRIYGSFTFLAELLWDVEVTGSDTELDSITPRSHGSCGKCRRCLDNCPTNALREPYSLDARYCVSYLTIEKRGAFSQIERNLIGEWVFGCDLCQEVCPHNGKIAENDACGIFSSFSADAGVGAYLDLATVLSIRSESEFRHRFARTALLRSRRAGLLRNAACVAANTAAEAVSSVLVEAFTADSSALVRQHALWALVKLQKVCNIFRIERLKDLVERGRRDPDDQVKREALELFEGYLS